MFTLSHARQLIDKNFNNDFAGLLVTENDYNDFIALVMAYAFNGHVNTDKNKLASAYKRAKIEFFGVSA
jgi:hypothetical protein